MASCEKCWMDACCDPYDYANLVYLRDRDGVTCAPEEQAGGMNALMCPKCGRKTVHIHCKQCMVEACREDASEYYAYKSPDANAEPETTEDAEPVSEDYKFSFEWGIEDWSPEEYKKAIEVITAMAFWLAGNNAEVEMPDWVCLASPIDKELLMECWDEWNSEREAGKK